MPKHYVISAAHASLPPAIGWWPVSFGTHHMGEWSWWNGERWSEKADERCNAEQAAAHAAQPLDQMRNDCLQWHDWPDGLERKTS